MSRWVLTVALAAALLGCNGKKKQATVPPVGSDAGASAPTTGGDPTACDAQRDKLDALYRAQAGAPPKDPAELALYDESISDNVHMVLTDCRRQPARYAPCIESATSVAYLETSCIEPLDEAGTVEGVRFGASAK